ncbi:hypothetical protein CLV43_103712 [Umezawaea tangerina]|uniref:Uncharacterized protein n=1 Tax=Umezawaea tangerina TaxID=84725 RepID=A0A2T0TE84_9PSEU|nr:hypothetical protein CLV43_103712 [Umezawaea tangerina]
MQAGQPAERRAQQRHGQQRALVHQEQRQRLPVDPRHDPRQERGPQQQHQADLRERQRERRHRRRRQVRPLAGHADRAGRVPAHAHQQRVPGDPGRQQRWPPRAPRPEPGHRDTELPRRPPDRDDVHRTDPREGEQDRQQHGGHPQVPVEVPAHRHQRRQREVDAEEPQRRDDQVRHRPHGVLRDAPRRQPHQDDRPHPEQHRDRHGEPPRLRGQRRRGPGGGEPADEEEQPQRLEHPRQRRERRHRPQRAVDREPVRARHQRRDQPVPGHHADDRDGPHGVDHGVAPGHRASPTTMRAIVRSESPPAR